MTREDLKRRLYRYKTLQAERTQILEELRKAEETLFAPSGGAYDGMPHKPGVGDPTQAAALKHAALLERYRRQLDDLAREQEWIETLIEGMEPRFRLLMRYRYLDGMTWEEVCVAICYSWRQTHTLHARALDQIMRKIDKGEVRP